MYIPQKPCGGVLYRAAQLSDDGLWSPAVVINDTQWHGIPLFEGTIQQRDGVVNVIAQRAAAVDVHL
jgi:hypothetical protein